MTAIALTSPAPQFFDLDGTPLDAGKIWFGIAGGNPLTSQLTVYWDSLQTEPAAQPIRTLNGYVVRNGRPAQLYLAAAASVLVQDARGVQVAYYADTTDFSNSASILSQLTSFITSLASNAGAALVGWIQAGAGAVLRTLQDKARDTVNVKDFGAVLNDATTPARTANSAALIAAATAGKRVEIGAGTLWLASSTTLPIDTQIVGAGKNSTFIKGDGDLLVLNATTFGANSEPYFADFTIANDVTRGKLVSVSGVSTDYGRAHFERIQFGKSTYHVQAHPTLAAVDWYFNGCRFTDASVRSREIPSCFAYREVGCYTWQGAQGLVIYTGATITCVGSVFEIMSGEAVYLLANIAAGIDTVSFVGCHFEQNGSSGASDIKIETTAAARIRGVSLIGSTLYNPNATMIKRISIVEGGGGTIDRVVVGDGTCVEGSVPLCDDLTRVFIAQGAAFNAISPRNTNQISPVVNYAARNVLSASGQVQPQSTPSLAWDYDQTNRAAIAIANNGTYDIGAGSGVVAIGESAGAVCGLLGLGTGTVTIIWQVGTGLSTVSGTASKVNVFYTGSAYRIENKTGAAVNIFLGMHRVRASN